MIKKLTRKTILVPVADGNYDVIKINRIEAVSVYKINDSNIKANYGVCIGLYSGKTLDYKYYFNSSDEASAVASYVGRLIK